MHGIRFCCRLAALVIAAGMVAGCTVDPFMETRPDVLDELPERHGVVAVQVTNNTRQIADQIETWTAVHVVDIEDTERVYRLRPSGTGLLGSRMFVGALPPGRYAIFNLHAHNHVGDRSYWLNAPVSRSNGTFQVDEGYLSSLGTLVYQPLGKAELEGRDKSLYLVARTDEEESLADFALASYPELAASVHAGEVGWDPDDLEDYREETSKRLRDFAIGTERHRLADGQVVMTGPLGMVMVRRGEGDWERFNTGASVQLAALTRHGDRYLVGGERGTVLAAEELEGPWHPMSGPGAMEAVFWMNSTPDGSLFALSRAANTVKFYRVSEDLSEWRALQEFEYRPRAFSTGRGQVFATTLPDGNTVLFADGRRIVFDSDGNTLADDENRHLLELRVQDDATLVAWPGSLWSGVGRLHYSRDGGITWDTLNRVDMGERERPRTRALHFILPDGDSLAFTHRGRTEVNRSRLVFDDKPRMRRVSADGSLVHWGEEVDLECTRLDPAISTKQMLFSWCEDGRVLLSEDQGRTWQIDFSPGTDSAEAEQLREAI